MAPCGCPYCLLYRYYVLRAQAEQELLAQEAVADGILPEVCPLTSALSCVECFVWGCTPASCNAVRRPS